MKNLIFPISTLIIALGFTLKSQNVPAQTNDDEQAIRATALNYIEGWYTADTTRMAKALSPDLHKIGFRVSPKTNQLQKLYASYPQMIGWTSERTDQFKQNPNIELKVQVIEIGKNIAMVKTTSPDFIDYIQMGKMDGEWKIYNVVWEPNYSIIK